METQSFTVQNHLVCENTVELLCLNLSQAAAVERNDRKGILEKPIPAFFTIGIADKITN